VFGVIPPKIWEVYSPGGITKNWEDDSSKGGIKIYEITSL